MMEDRNVPPNWVSFHGMFPHVWVTFQVHLPIYGPPIYVSYNRLVFDGMSIPREPLLVKTPWFKFVPWEWVRAWERFYRNGYLFRNAILGNGYHLKKLGGTHLSLYNRCTPHPPTPLRAEETTVPVAIDGC